MRRSHDSRCASWNQASWPGGREGCPTPTAGGVLSSGVVVVIRNRCPPDSNYACSIQLALHPGDNEVCPTPTAGWVLSGGAAAAIKRRMRSRHDVRCAFNQHRQQA